MLNVAAAAADAPLHCAVTLPGDARCKPYEHICIWNQIERGRRRRRKQSGESIRDRKELAL